jgi:ketosteroid isomerase-like protein
MTEALLRAYAQAWNDHDVDAVMARMTDDCVFHASIGPDLLGQTHVGQSRVREAVAAFFLALPDARWVDTDVFVCGTRGYSEWTLRATRADGALIATRGCDLFEFADDKIRVKNAFRKQRP